MFLWLALIGCPAPQKTTVVVENATTVDTTVYVAFGADSQVTASNWPFCSGEGLNCSFSLAKKSTQPLLTHAQYLNATFSFFHPVTCGTTKAEVNVNNPNWYDVADISLVDGFNVPVEMDFAGQKLIVTSAKGNETAFGVYPDGCDICTGRAAPPCGQSRNNEGCKSGTQFDPSVPCQAQGSVLGGGSNAVVIRLIDLEPA